jgi:hypothetical protein
MLFKWIFSNTLSVDVDRDSVCAGDDSISHQSKISIAASASVLELLVAAQRVCPLASIIGGRATWLIKVGRPGGKRIGVIAQQWAQPKLVLAEDTPLAQLFRGTAASLKFQYWCQADPDAVFEAVRSGTPLPDRYAQRAQPVV